MPGVELDWDAVNAAVREAGALALNSWVRGSATSSRHWQKGAAGPVSDADLAVDRLLRDRLTAILPEAGWLSEETPDTGARLGQRLLWVVDPIDGTRDYVAGLDGWAVSVAFVGDGRALFGALFAPARDQYFCARAGRGACGNDLPLRASQRTEISGSRVPADYLPADITDVVKVECPNSIALRIVKVAADEADAVASVRWGAEWDIAAAALIAAEAGAAVTDARGQSLSYNGADGRIFGVLCTAPALHEVWQQRIAGRVAKVLAQES